MQVSHLEAGLLAQVTHVAVGAEGEIVVVAALADPVTGSLIRRRSFLLFFSRQRHRCETTFQGFPRSLGGIEAGLCPLDPFCRGRQICIHFKILKFTALLHLDPLQFQSGRGVLLISLEQVKRLTSQILFGSCFLASVALFSALEIVVLAL